jgi:NitT/TauT family transport system permease protein
MVASRWSDVGLRCLSGATFLVLWQAAAAAAASPLLPGPAAVAAALVDLALHGRLLVDLGITLLRVASSFALAMAAGSAIGILMGHSRRVDGLFDLWLVLGLNIPALVLIFLCYLWLGLTEVAAIVAVALNKVPNTAVILREGARTVDRELLQVADVLKLTRGRRLSEVYLPQLYPYFMAASRSGLSLIWKIVLVVELLGRSDGVGFKLQLYFQLFDVPHILAYALAFAAIVQAIEWGLLQPLERHVGRWRR